MLNPYFEHGIAPECGLVVPYPDILGPPAILTAHVVAAFAAHFVSIAHVFFPQGVDGIGAQSGAGPQDAPNRHILIGLVGEFERSEQLLPADTLQIGEGQTGVDAGDVTFGAEIVALPLTVRLIVRALPLASL